METAATADFDQVPEEADEKESPQTQAEDMAAREKEIEMEQALEEEGAATKKAEPENEDIVDILQPKAKVVKWTIGKGQLEREFIQRELSFISKMEWFGLVGEVLDKAMGGENALTVGNLMSGPQARGTLTISDFKEADTFVHAVGKLLTYAPDFLTKSYCIWLSVPDFDRELVKEIMSLPPEEGGLSDDQGIEIIETFIDQNYEALDRFFREKLGQLQKRVEQRIQVAQESRQ